MVAALEESPEKTEVGAEKAEIVAEFERVFRVFNAVLFDGRLELPPVILQPRQRYTVRWMWDTGDLSVGGDFGTASEADILADTLHEMVHMWNAAEGRIDCTSNAYHNSKFVEVALDAGLVVCHQKTQGWGITCVEPPPDATKDSCQVPKPPAIRRREKAFGQARFDPAFLTEAQEYVRRLRTNNRTNKVYFLKYKCGCPEPFNSIRCGRKPDGHNPLRAVCNHCKKPFVVVRPDTKSEN